MKILPIKTMALAIAVLALLAGALPAFAGPAAPVARQGVLHLGSWNPAADGPVRLDGQWEFYWKKRFSPRDLEPGQSPSAPAFFPMPSVWNGFENKGVRLGGAGFATFRLKIRFTHPVGTLALHIPYGFTAYRLWVDQRPAAACGTVGQTAAAAAPRYQTHVVSFRPRGLETEVVLQVSNFHHAKGGMRDALVLGTPSQITGKKHRAMIREVLVFGCLVIMSIYHLALFAFRRQDRFNLYFALLCLLFGVRAGLTGEVFLVDLFETLGWQVAVRLEWLPVYLGGPLAIGFVRSLFPEACADRIYRAGLVIGAVLALVTLLAPSTVFTGMFPFLSPVVALMLGYCAWILLRASIDRRSGARFMLASLLVVLATVVNDMLYANDLIKTGHVISFGMIFFVLSQATMLAIRSSRAFAQLEQTNIAYGAEMLERERAEAAVRAYQGRLEELVENRTEALDAANRRLRRELDERKAAEAEKLKLQGRLQRAQKMEALGTLAGGVAHDLNNVLSGLVGYPDLLLQDLPEESEMRKPMLTIQQSGRKAAAIVQDLLTLARRGVSDFRVLNLNHVVADYLESPEFKKMLQFHPGVEIESVPAPDLMHVAGSPVHLFKTLMNLVNNAAEASPDGGVIRICTENRYLDRPLGLYDEVTEGEYVVMSVEDTGIGISDEEMERIFEPFYTKKVMGQSGTGLGMAVVWGTVKDHRGYIDARSRKGAGTAFTLYLPATRERPKSAPAPWSLAAHRGRGERILVVDDVAEQRDIATAMLEKLGYRAEAVESGEAAVARVAKQPVDLLVLDMIMAPGIDGLETYRQVLALCPGQKAILASGFAETDRVRQAQNLGAGVYLKKPYRLAALARAVQSMLGTGPA